MPCIQSWDSLNLPENERPIVHSSPRRISAQTVSRRTPAEGLLDDVDSPSDKDDLLTDDDDLLTDDDDELLTAPDKSSSQAGPKSDKPKPLGKGSSAANDGDDPLAGMGPASGGIKSKPLEPVSPNSGAAAAIDSTHPLEQLYPSAQTCAKCHPQQYDEWRVSAHAYSYVSPTFHRFEQTMQDLTQGTVGSFCVRCHSPVGTQLCVPPSTSVLDVPPIVREGITCVACHRVQEAVWRTHGDRRIEPGDIHAPIIGGSNGAGVNAAIADAAKLKLKLSPDEPGPGQPMHRHCGPFEPIRKSDFCASCHQVAVHPGIWLEIVHAQYRSGPANAKGITCQQCHMGSVPGKPDGFESIHWAEVANKPYGEPKKHFNHMFWGPGYSIAHPGIFPHNKDAAKYSPRDWLNFDYRAGWGMKEFEQSDLSNHVSYPKPWDNRDERISGRKIIDANLAKLQEKRGGATLTLAGAVRVDGPEFARPPLAAEALKFSYRVANISEGHNFPTGSLGAQPQMWLNVALINPQGHRIWETGFLDSNGDLADLQSEDVNHKRISHDAQLFNLQTKFLVNNVRGTDREAPVPLNFSLDQLVFLRPGAVPVSVLNHPPLIRMEAHSIEPLGHRFAHYVVPAQLVAQPGLYRLSVRLRSRPEPPYLLRLLKGSPEMIRNLNEQIIDLETDSHTFVVGEGR